MILLRWLYDAIKNRGKGLPDWKLQTTLRATAVMVAVSAPWVIYNLVMFSTDVYLRGWASQNLIISPPWQDYLISFLIILPFAAWGAVRLLQNKSSLYAFFPASVMMVFPLLAYAPFNMQRRLPDGIWLALVIAGFSLFENRKNNAQRSVPFALMAISLLTPVIILAGAFQAIRTPGQPIYQPEEQVIAFEYLGASAPAGSVVLAAYETSNALPAWAAVRVVAGLGPESVYFDSAVGDVNLFFSGNLSGESQTEMLRKYSVDYVFYGPQERRLGDWNPADSTYLQKVYERDGYAIYTVFLNDDNK
ncbi:MAG: hypothetical protein AAGU05_08785 [Anaerolineaceae bacterium]